MPIPKAFIGFEPLAFGSFQFIRTHGGVNARPQCNLAHNFHGVRNDVQGGGVCLVDEITSTCIALVFPSNTSAQQSLHLGIIRHTRNDAGEVKRPAYGSALQLQLVRPSFCEDANYSQYACSKMSEIHTSMIALETAQSPRASPRPVMFRGETSSATFALLFSAVVAHLSGIITWLWRICTPIA